MKFSLNVSSSKIAVVATILGSLSLTACGPEMVKNGNRPKTNVATQGFTGSTGDASASSSVASNSATIASSLFGTLSYVRTDCDGKQSDAVNNQTGGQVSIAASDVTRWYYNYNKDGTVCWATEYYKVLGVDSVGTTIKIKMNKLIQKCETAASAGGSATTKPTTQASTQPATKPTTQATTKPTTQAATEASSYVTTWTDTDPVNSLSSADMAERTVRLGYGDGYMWMEHLGGDTRCSGKPVDVFQY